MTRTAKTAKGEIKFYKNGEAHDIFSNVSGGIPFNVEGIDVTGLENAYQGLAKGVDENGNLTNTAVSVINDTKPNVQRFGTIIESENSRKDKGYCHSGYKGAIPKEVAKRYAGEEQKFTVKEQLMYELIRCKFSQNPSALKALLETGDRQITENTQQASYDDSFWGNGHGGNGHNALGKLLMAYRAEARGELASNGKVKVHTKLSDELKSGLGLKQNALGNSQPMTPDSYTQDDLKSVKPSILARDVQTNQRALQSSQSQVHTYDFVKFDQSSKANKSGFHSTASQTFLHVIQERSGVVPGGFSMTQAGAVKVGFDSPEDAQKFAKSVGGAPVSEDGKSVFMGEKRFATFAKNAGIENFGRNNPRPMLQALMGEAKTPQQKTPTAPSQNSNSGTHAMRVSKGKNSVSFVSGNFSAEDFEKSSFGDKKNTVVLFGGNEAHLTGSWGSGWSGQAEAAAAYADPNGNKGNFALPITTQGKMLDSGFESGSVGRRNFLTEIAVLRMAIDAGVNPVIPGSEAGSTFPGSLAHGVLQKGDNAAFVKRQVADLQNHKPENPAADGEKGLKQLRQFVANRAEFIEKHGLEGYLDFFEKNPGKSLADLNSDMSKALGREMKQEAKSSSVPQQEVPKDAKGLRDSEKLREFVKNLPIQNEDGKSFKHCILGDGTHIFQQISPPLPSVTPGRISVNQGLDENGQPTAGTYLDPGMNKLAPNIAAINAGNAAQKNAATPSQEPSQTKHKDPNDTTKLGGEGKKQDPLQNIANLAQWMEKNGEKSEAISGLFGVGVDMKVDEKDGVKKYTMDFQTSGGHMDDKHGTVSQTVSFTVGDDGKPKLAEPSFSDKAGNWLKNAAGSAFHDNKPEAKSIDFLGKIAGNFVSGKSGNHSDSGQDSTRRKLGSELSEVDKKIADKCRELAGDLKGLRVESCNESRKGSVGVTSSAGKGISVGGGRDG